MHGLYRFLFEERVHFIHFFYYHIVAKYIYGILFDLITSFSGFFKKVTLEIEGRKNMPHITSHSITLRSYLMTNRGHHCT